MRPRQNGRHFTVNVLCCIFVNKNAWILVSIWQKPVPKGQINNNSSLIQVMAWCCRTGGKLLSELCRTNAVILYGFTKPKRVNWIEMVRRTASNWRPSAHKQTTTWYVTANTLRWRVCTTIKGINSLILDRVTCNLRQEFSSMLYDCTDSVVARKSTKSSRQQLSYTGCPLPRPKLNLVYFIKRHGFIIIHDNYKWAHELWLGRFLTNHMQNKYRLKRKEKNSRTEIFYQMNFFFLLRSVVGSVLCKSARCPQLIEHVLCIINKGRTS